MSCATVPTETQFQVVTTTSNSLSTSLSVAVTTLPPTIVTSTIGCSGSVSNSSCSTTTLVTDAGSTSANTVPVTLMVPVPLTSSNPTRTLFSISCGSSSTSAPSISMPSNKLTPQSSPSTTSSSPTPVSTSPSLVSSSSAVTILPDGSTVTSQVIVTTTSSPSVFVTPQASASLSPSGTGGGGNSTSNIAPIIGGTVGSLIGVLAIIGVIWYIRRRSKRWNGIFEKEEEEDEDLRRPRMSLAGEDVQPRPYHYGLVGQSLSPHSSPQLGAVRPGHSPSNSFSLLNPTSYHSRSSSGAALSSPASMTRSLSDLGSVNAARPSLSTASGAAPSTLPLLERPINHTRAPSNLNANLLGDPLSPRPHSAGGPSHSVSSPTLGASTEPLLPPHTSPSSEKPRFLATLPQGATSPTPPSIAIESGSSAVHVQQAESSPPPIRQRNPKRPPFSKNVAVTVHVDGGPAAETGQQSRPGGSEPPAYSPT